MKLNEKIYEYRKLNRWSQEELADKLDVSRQTISKWEVGKAVPELDKLIKLAELFNITVDELVKDNIEIVYKENVNNLTKEEKVEDFVKEENHNKKVFEKIIEKFKIKKDRLMKFIKVGIILFIVVILYSFISNKFTLLKREKNIEEIGKVYNEQFRCVGITESAVVAEKISKKENNVITETYRHYYIYGENGKHLMKATEYADRSSQDIIKEIYIDLSKVTYIDWNTNMRKYDDVTEIYIDDWSSKQIDDYEFISPIDRISDALDDKYFNISHNSEKIARDKNNDIFVLKIPKYNVENYGWSYGIKDNSNREDYFDLQIYSPNSLFLYFDNYKNDIADTREIVDIQLSKQKGSIDDVTVPEL